MVGSYQASFGQNPYIRVSRSMVFKFKEFTDVEVMHVANEWIISPISPLQVASNNRLYVLTGIEIYKLRLIKVNLYSVWFF